MAQYVVDISQIPNSPSGLIGVNTVIVSAATPDAAIEEISRRLGVPASVFPRNSSGLLPSSVVRIATDNDISNQSSVDVNTLSRMLSQISETTPTASSGSYRSIEDQIASTMNFGERTGSGAFPTGGGLAGAAGQGTAAAGAGAGGGLSVDPLVGDILPDSSFRAFQRANGVNPGGVGGFLSGTQFGPALDAFTALNSLGVLPEGTSFADLLRGGSLGPTRFGQLSRGALNAVNPAEGTNILGPKGTFTDFASNVANLAFAAANGGRSPILADFGQGTPDRLQQALRDQAFAQQSNVTPETFAQYALNFFGGNRASDPALTRLALGR